MRPDTVMIFAAGFGTRMGALTRSTPKPLLTVAGEALIDRSRRLAQAAGVRNAVVNAHYRAEEIEAHLDGSGTTVLREDPVILDTGGGLKAAAGHLGRAPVFTANPDAVWAGPNPFAYLADRAGDAAATLLVVPVSGAVGRDFGDFDLADGRVTRGESHVYGGIQIIDPDRAARVPETVFSLNRVWDELIAEGALRAVVYPGRWCDVGTPDGLRRAEALLSEGPA